MTMFWKRLKSPDQKAVCHRIATNQPIPTMIDTDTGSQNLERIPLIQITLFYDLRVQQIKGAVHTELPLALNTLALPRD